MGRVILVTGVSRYLGGRCARLLAQDPSVDRVIGVDVVPPPDDIGDAEFVRADIRNPVIAKVIASAGVDTVVHMSVIATPTGAGGRVSMKEINVIGTMQLLAACQKSPSVQRLVVKSTSGVYGASSRDPALFTEETPAKVLPRTGWAKDSVEVEGYVRGFSRRRSHVQVCTLRLANVLGPGLQTTLADYFSLPVVPTVLGFDGRFQLLHEEDALAAMRLATLSDVTGTINVAGDGVLLVSQAIHMAGRPTVMVPRPLVGLVGRAIARAKLGDFSAQRVQFISYGRVMDVTKMRTVLGLEPQFTTRETFEDFVRTRNLRGPFSPGTLVAGERMLVSTLERLGLPVQVSGR